jgi:predicted PurR-regulated permease PerM
MLRKIPNREVVAWILTLCLGVGILVPGVWAAHTLIGTAISGVSEILPMTRSQLEHQYPKAREALERLESSLQISSSLGQLLQTLGQQTRHLITLSAWGVISLLLTLFTFFYIIRDGRRFLARLGEFLPLSGSEKKLLYSRISDTIHATLLGSVVVSAAQGLLGALLIWWLGLPGAPLWGLLMGLLALIPYLGAFVVWIPLAALFVLQGQWHEAIVTTAWGMIVIGLSDNLLYPILVGKRLRYHSLVVFFFLVGGVWSFGSAGIIIGPVVLTIVDTAIDIWKGKSIA